MMSASINSMHPVVEVDTNMKILHMSRMSYANDKLEHNETKKCSDSFAWHARAYRCTPVSYYFTMSSTKLVIAIVIVIYVPVWQLVSVYPGRHMQVYSFTASVHVPPLSHGLLSQSLVSKIENISSEE